MIPEEKVKEMAARAVAAEQKRLGAAFERALEDILPLGSDEQRREWIKAVMAPKQQGTDQ